MTTLTIRHSIKLLVVVALTFCSLAISAPTTHVARTEDLLDVIGFGTTHQYSGDVCKHDISTCENPRECRDAQLEPCVADSKFCICLQQGFTQCSESSTCLLGDRCARTLLSTGPTNLCISCNVIAENSNFVPIDDGADRCPATPSPSPLEQPASNTSSPAPTAEQSPTTVAIESTEPEVSSPSVSASPEAVPSAAATSVSPWASVSPPMATGSSPMPGESSGAPSMTSEPSMAANPSMESQSPDIGANNTTPSPEASKETPTWGASPTNEDGGGMGQNSTENSPMPDNGGNSTDSGDEWNSSGNGNDGNNSTSTVQPSMSPESDITTDGGSPNADEEDNSVGPTTEPTNICVAIDSLKHLHNVEFVYKSARRASVLCDKSETCATPSHIVVYDNQVLTMRDYCMLIEEGCTKRIKLVNSPQMKAGVRLPSASGHLIFTPFAAQFNTKLEKLFFRGIVKLGF